MQTRTIVLGSLLACGLAYGGILMANLITPMSTDLGEPSLEPVRASGGAKYQPQDGKITLQSRHSRDNPVLTAAVASRDACPRCAIGE
ncbi:MAG: hypothetical protein WAS21_31985 [Geminicoccaceae bacterium]